MALSQPMENLLAITRGYPSACIYGHHFYLRNDPSKRREPGTRCISIGRHHQYRIGARLICLHCDNLCLYQILQEWASPLTIVNYTLLGMASGFALCTAFAAYVAPDAIYFYGSWSIALTVFAFYLSRNFANKKHKY